jgi:hypothetical protein
MHNHEIIRLPLNRSSALPKALADPNGRQTAGSQVARPFLQDSQDDIHQLGLRSNRLDGERDMSFQLYNVLSGSNTTRHRLQRDVHTFQVS